MADRHSKRMQSDAPAHQVVGDGTFGRSCEISGGTWGAGGGGRGGGGGGEGGGAPPRRGGGAGVRAFIVPRRGKRRPRRHGGNTVREPGVETPPTVERATRNARDSITRGEGREAGRWNRKDQTQAPT